MDQDGNSDRYPLPFAIPWVEGMDEQREIMSGATYRLLLVHVQPEGDMENFPIAPPGGAVKASVERLRHRKPGRFRFKGPQGREYIGYMDLRDQAIQESSWIPSKRTYLRDVRVVISLRSDDGAVNETKTVKLGIRESKKPKKPGTGYDWGQDDEVIAEIEPS